MTIKELEKTMPELAKKFKYLDACMSPENLYCDGEISHSQAMARLNQITKEWHKLEKQVGQSVSGYEM